MKTKPLIKPLVPTTLAAKASRQHARQTVMGRVQHKHAGSRHHTTSTRAQPKIASSVESQGMPRGPVRNPLPSVNTDAHGLPRVKTHVKRHHSTAKVKLNVALEMDSSKVLLQKIKTI